MVNLFPKHALVLRTYFKKSLIMVSIFDSKSKSFMTMSILLQGKPSINRPVVSYVKNAKESWALIEDLTLYDNESWNDPRDFAKPIKEISLPQDVPNAFDRRLIELENQVQRLMEAHLAPKSSDKVNTIASSWRKFIANAYIDLDLPINVMSLAYYNAIRSPGCEFKGINFVGIGRDMHVFIGNMNHIMDFTILDKVEANTDPFLSQVVFGRPFVEISKLILDRKQGLITFTDGIKEVTFKTPYRDSMMGDLTSEGHELLSSRVILSEDDFRIRCERPSDLESGFYKDIDKLGHSYKIEFEG
ncbi:hypothetical protein Tco_0522517 [Tanacetum coccineum]